MGDLLGWDDPWYYGLPGTYTQCLLESQAVSQVTWIPTEFAVAGGTVDLRNKDGLWSEGWRVVEVWTTISGDKLHLGEYLLHREVKLGKR